MHIRTAIYRAVLEVRLRSTAHYSTVSAVKQNLQDLCLKSLWGAQLTKAAIMKHLPKLVKYKT